jgi:hypothetical protein
LINSKIVGQNSFDFLYSTQADNLIKNGVVDHEGSAILVGHIGDLSSDESIDGFVMKVNPDGSYVAKQFDLSDTVSSFHDAVILDDGNYMVFGSKGDSGYYQNNFWVLTLDHELEVLSEKTYEIDDYYTGVGASMKAVLDNDRNIAIAGLVFEKVNEYQFFTDYVLYKLTQEGDTLYSRYYSYPYNQLPYELMRIPETDHLLLLGDRITTNAIPSVLILDSEMEILNSYSFQIYPSPLSQRLSAAKWLNETDFLMAGTRQLPDEKYIDNYIAVFRMNTSAELFEELMLTVPDTSIYRAWNRSITEANDSTIYVAGFQAFADISTPNAVYLFLIDSQMNLLGRKSFYIGDDQYQVWGTLAMPDNGCLMTISKMRISDQGYLERDVYIRKYLREDFEIITSVEDYPLNKIAAKAWPNPADDLLHISIEGLETGQDFRLCIYDIAGQKYLDKAHIVSGNTVQCRIDVLPSGTYVYEIEADRQHLLSGKFIKN